MDEKSVSFTMHALLQARTRHLWKFVNKKKFFYDASYLSPTTSILENCVYAHVNKDGITKITTMYQALYPKKLRTRLG